MKTIVLVIAENNFRDEEYYVPKDILKNFNFNVLTASTTTKSVTGKLGMVVVPDLLLSDVDINSIDGLFFIGGGGAEQYFTDNIALNLVRDAEKKGKVYGAICIAPVILGNAGVLNNKKATVFQSEISTIKNMGAEYINEDVVVDGHLITANGPMAAKKFGETIAKHISKKQMA